MKTTAASLALALIALPTSPATAGTIEGAAAVSAAATDHSGDSAVAVGVDLGYRFSPYVGAYLRLAAGAGAERERSIQALGAGMRFAYPLGKDGAWRPSARVGFLHQHEVSRMDLGAAEVLGYGDGIDHRSGGTVALAITRDLARYRYGALYTGLEIGTDVFADADPGPRAYFGGTLVFGLTLERSSN